MVSNPTVLIQSVLTLTILIIMLFNRIRYKITPLNYPIVIVLFAHLRADVDFLFNQSREFFNVAENAHFVLYGLTVYALYLFGETIIETKYQAWRKNFVSFLFGIFIGMYLSALIFQDYLASLAGNCIHPIDTSKVIGGCNPSSWPFASYIPFYELAMDIFQTLVFVFLVYIYVIAYFKTSSQKRRRPLVLLILSMLLFVTVSLIELGEHFLNYEINAWITSIAAFALLVIVYLVYYRITYIAAVDLYRLSVVNSMSGMPLFKLKFTDRELFDLTLVASMSMSINETFKEVTKSDGNIREIDIEYSKVMMYHSSKIFVILEAEWSPTILKNALADFTEAFELKYGHYIDNFQGKLEELEGIDEFITRYFPNV